MVSSNGKTHDTHATTERCTGRIILILDTVTELSNAPTLSSANFRNGYRVRKYAARTTVRLPVPSAPAVWC